jgi:hypothetical protein
MTENEEPFTEEEILSIRGLVEDTRGLEDANTTIARIARGELDEAIEHVTKQLEREDAAREKLDDPVNHPAHYNQYNGIEVIQLTEQMNFNRGNAVKYICRAGFKAPEKELEDLRKARWYLDREIDRVLKGQNL